jgi:hypothetical protein
MKRPRYLLSVAALLSCAPAFAQDSLSPPLQSQATSSTTQRVLQAGTPRRAETKPRAIDEGSVRDGQT